MSRDEDYNRIQHHVEQLGEHYDTVMIFTTRHEKGIENGTINCQYGSGNWFARIGHVRNWLMKEDESTRCEVRREEGS